MRIADTVILLKFMDYFVIQKEKKKNPNPSVPLREWEMGDAKTAMGCMRAWGERGVGRGGPEDRIIFF